MSILTHFDQANIPLAYIFAETPEERAELAETLKPLAIKHKGAVNFATIDAKSFGAHAGNLNLEVGKWPAFAIQETVKNQKFPFDSTKLTEKAVGKFVDDFVSGKLSPSIKSEPIPEKQDSPVTVIVAHTYKELIIDNDKDVLVEFYAPWCGHCKALAPKWEELAGLYTSVSDKVMVAKIDATANDVPDDIAGFPAIKLFPAGSKDSPVEYSGGRTVEDFVNFVKENGKYKIDAWSNATEDEDVIMTDAQETMGKAAPAATTSEESQGVGASIVSEAVEAAKTMLADTDEGGVQEHDEL